MLSYTTPRATLQQVLLKYYVPPASGANTHVHHVLHRISICHSASLGYHVFKCSNEQCGHIKYQYHSCRDRHCPCCGAIKKQQWIEARMQELLPVKYYHLLFTLPHELNGLAMQAVFKGKFLEALSQMIAHGEVILPAPTDAKQLLNVLYQKDWVLYAKTPFAGPHAVIEYLGVHP